MKVSEVLSRRKVLAVTFKSSCTLICFIGIIGILLLSILVSLCLGRYDVTPMEILKQFFTREDHPFISTIIFNIRLPRIIIALLAGGVLTISGCTYQAVFRNPMVSPAILGVSSGALMQLKPKWMQDLNLCRKQEQNSIVSTILI